MGKNEILETVKADFKKEVNLESVKKSYCYDRLMSANRFVITPEMVDFLRDEFNNNYDGGVIPIFFDELLIEAKAQGFYMYVRRPKETEMLDVAARDKWVFIDLYGEAGGKKELVNLITVAYYNIVRDETDENGHFRDYSICICHANLNSEYVSAMTTVVKDVFMYTHLYFDANKSTKGVAFTERENQHAKCNSTKAQKKASGSKKKAKPSRRIVHIPKVYTFIKTEKSIENVRNYIVGRWYVRGYEYDTKSGKHVKVEGHWARRHALEGKNAPTGEGTIYLFDKKK